MKMVRNEIQALHCKRSFLFLCHVRLTSVQERKDFRHITVKLSFEYFKLINFVFVNCLDKSTEGAGKESWRSADRFRLGRTAPIRGTENFLSSARQTVGPGMFPGLHRTSSLIGRTLCGASRLTARTLSILRGATKPPLGCIETTSIHLRLQNRIS